MNNPTRIQRIIAAVDNPKRRWLRPLILIEALLGLMVGYSLSDWIEQVWPWHDAVGTAGRYLVLAAIVGASATAVHWLNIWDLRSSGWRRK